MTLDLRSIPWTVSVGGVDLSLARVSLSIGGNALDDSGWFRPRGQIVLAAYADGVTEDMDCRTNPGRWAPGTVVAVSVWLGSWIPLPWQLRILSYPNRPSPAQPTLTLEVGTDADLLNYRAPEGDPGTDEYGTPAGATVLINRALAKAGAPSLTDTITTLSLPFSPAKTTSTSWMTYAGSVAYAARHLLWQQTDGTIRATPLTLDGLTPIAAYTVGTDEADYILDRVGEQPPEVVEVQGTTYRIEDATPEDTDVTEVVNGVTTRTRVEYRSRNVSDPVGGSALDVIETIWIPLELMNLGFFVGNSVLSIYRRTTTTKKYDQWDRLVEIVTTTEQPRFTVLGTDENKDRSTTNSSLMISKRTTVTIEFPFSFISVDGGPAPEDIVRQIKTTEVMKNRVTIEESLYERRVNNVIVTPLGLQPLTTTTETWEKKSAESYLYTTKVRQLQLPGWELSSVGSIKEPSKFTPPPATEFKPAAKQRTELQRRGQARFTNAVGSSYAEKKAIITLPSGMAASSDQCRAHAALWGRIRQGRQFPIRWAADLSATWLQNWSPVRRVDFTLGGVTTAYLVEAFNIQIDQRSAAVGGLGFELGILEDEP